MEQFHYPAPDIESELNAISAVAEQTGLNPDGTVLAAADSLAALHEISARAYKLAKDISLSAISEGNLSQLKAAKLLDVHPITVHRWVHDARHQQDQ